MADILKSLTPIALALTGGLIAVMAIVSPSVTSDKFGTTMGVCSTFAAGAAGLASPQKSKD
jgi:hypothetical protein